ncbi:unnamed protein product [Cylicocyclus nassatus]|uniref:Uncharacterized protein n=1 Tax=Cylicocyclus nassatus TaxID=53992 RepID=A0AA36DPW2_CYLNA|nr:unnamed protein product [Cylicocyclus nassatus]
MGTTGARGIDSGFQVFVVTALAFVIMVLFLYASLLLINKNTDETKRKKSQTRRSRRSIGSSRASRSRVSNTSDVESR